MGHCMDELITIGVTKNFTIYLKTIWMRGTFIKQKMMSFFNLFSMQGKAIRESQTLTGLHI